MRPCAFLPVMMYLRNSPHGDALLMFLQTGVVGYRAQLFQTGFLTMYKSGSCEFGGVRTHFCNNACTYDRFCDRRLVVVTFAACLVGQNCNCSRDTMDPGRRVVGKTL